MTDTITLPRAELQAALDALTSVKDMAWSEDTQAGRELVGTIRARLAQQEEKPEHELKDIRCECCGYMTHHREHMGCIRAAIKQEEKPEPVAEIENGSLRWHIPGPNRSVDLRNLKGKHFLYTAPPQREWQGLTDDDVEEQYWAWKDMTEYPIPFFEYRAIARAIEQKLKEKNT